VQVFKPCRLWSGLGLAMFVGSMPVQNSSLYICKCQYTELLHKCVGRFLVNASSLVFLIRTGSSFVGD